ncbi:amidohydrolase [Actinomadura viridis]|uniref:Hippurate hydrolase n=1 Tax=Actinomadura viridis TaxID=58110 RepID=A0A931DMY6_9ACTN|nr:amidohydrolase [Actinomadura viridis]MBG6092920.1 hippurate hydrolase [Actinomadura viridis]
MPTVDVLRSLPEALPDLEAVYRDLHAHPELAYTEHRTAGIVAGRLRRDGFEVTEGIGVTGVVGVLRNGAGPTVVLRADMDALPVEEKTGLGYASTATTTDETGEVVPLMHACGHDVHVTCLLGAAHLMAASAGLWSGTLVALFQPAEEGRGGAQRMIADGLFDVTGKPDIVLGQHVFPYPAGTVGYRPGPFLAASDGFDVRLYGRGAHGSRPESGVDPVVLAASAVMRLQTIVAREVAANEQAVLTVGALHAGTKANIIADHADLSLSVRSFDRKVSARMVASVRRIIEAECAASGSPRPPEFAELFGFTPTVNDPVATERVAGGLRALLGEDAVSAIPPIMGSEDFGEFGEVSGAPSVFWALGGADPGAYAAALEAGTVDQEIPSNHSPLFAPVVRPTLTTGVSALVAAGMEWLGDGRA